MKLTWRDMAQRALPGREISVLDGRTPDPEQLESVDVVVCNYDILTAWAKALHKHKFRAVVADDAHVLKERARIRNGKLDGPQRNYDFKRLADQVRRSDGLVLLVTASPVIKRARDLIGPLTILGQMHAFGGTQAFKDQFCDPQPAAHGTSYDGTTNPDLLNVRLRETCMARRLKRDVLPDLPAKQRTLVRLELNARDRARYQRAKADIVAFLRAERQRAAQATLIPDTAAANAAKAPVLARLNTLRQLVAEAKLPAVIDWTKTFLDSGEKLILFAEHRDIQHALLREFPDCARVLGGSPAQATQAHVERFQTDAACQLIVCSLQAASHGLTLTAASNVAFAEMAWTAAPHDHGEDRAYGRLDNPHCLSAWYLLADDTLDFDLAELVDERRELAAAITEGDKAAPDRLLGESLHEDLIARWAT